MLDNVTEIAKPKYKHLGLWMIAAVTLILLLVAGSASYYTVDQGDRAVVLTNGKITAIAGPGLHFKVPFFQSVIHMDVRSNSQTFENVAAYSFDQQVAELKVSVRYRIEEDQVGNVYANYGQAGIVPRVLSPKVFEQVKNIFGGYTAQAAIQKRAELNLQVEKAISDSVTGTGLAVESIQIENIDFSDDYEHAVEAAAEAKANIEKAKSELARIEQEAQQQVKQAEAEAKAKYLQADADAYATKARGEAEAYAIKQRGDALQQRPELIKLTIAEKWNGQLPNTMLPNAALPLLDLK